MTGGETLYLVLVIVATTVFALALAWVSRQSSKSQIILPRASDNP
jgi:hypothetical protein